jgi:hypothetical protein
MLFAYVGAILLLLIIVKNLFTNSKKLDIENNPVATHRCDGSRERVGDGAVDQALADIPSSTRR